MTHRPFIGAALGSVVLAAGVVEVHAEGDIIYDNGPVDTQVGGLNSVLDTAYPFYSAAADDFVFSSSDFPGANTMTVTGVNWAGETHPGGPAPITGIRILIWPDAGGVPAGGQPPGLPPDESQALHIFEIHGNGNEMPTAGTTDRFTYSLKLPESVELEMDVVYWLQIQVVFHFPPQWHCAGSGDGLGIGNPAVQGFDLLDLAFWTAFFDDYSLSFQLQGFETVDCPCPWDLDNTNVVGTADLLDLLAQWGTNPGGPPDFNGDGNVGTSDLLELLSNWGPC